MANPEHVEVVKQGAEAIAKWREGNPDVRLDLYEADLHGADLRGADLHEADLHGVDLRGTILYEADLHEADLSAADLRSAILGGATLTGANLFGADLRSADLHGANLRRATLMGANLFRADLYEANLSGTDLSEVRGAEHGSSLETVRFISAEDDQGSGSGNDASYFDTCRRPWPERWLDWERLRVVGRLPLFGISYTALILIPVVFYALALYNDKIELIRAWAEQTIVLPDSPLSRVAPLVLDRLHPRPIPSLSFLLLLSTILLAAGSTLYTFFCPSRIKEFSRDQWCDQLGRSLLHYWPLAWRHRYIRLACAACYALGGLGAAWVLVWKLGHTARFILEHSTWPWPWR